MIKRILCLLSFFISCHLFAQEHPFTQFSQQPILLNPALAGHMPGKWRASFIYRDQLRRTVTPYLTFGAGGEYTFFSTKTGHKMTAGLQLINDRQGSIYLRRTYVTPAFSYAYHTTGKTSHRIGFGISGGFVTEKISFSDLTFPVQYDGTTFNPTLSNGQNLSESAQVFGVFHAGIHYSVSPSKKLRLGFGIQFRNILHTASAYLDEKPSPFGLIQHLSVDYSIGKRFTFSPAVLFGWQYKDMNTQPGIEVTYDFRSLNNTKLSGGVWYRAEDAVMLTLAVHIQEARIGVAYDIVSSSLKNAPNHQQSFEISLLLTGGQRTDPDLGPIFAPCPRL